MYFREANLEAETIDIVRMYNAVLGEMNWVRIRSNSDAHRHLNVSIEVLDGRYPRDDLSDLALVHQSVETTYGGEPPELKETESQRVVGFAETLWSPDSPQVLFGWTKAVTKRWRGRQLGTILTARLLREASARLPSAKTVQITLQESARRLHEQVEAIGFRLHHSEAKWRIDRSALHRFLALENRVHGTRR